MSAIRSFVAALALGCVTACQSNDDESEEGQVWSTPIRPTLTGLTLMPAEVGGGIAVLAADRRLLVFDSRTGRLLWSVSETVASFNVRPFVHDGLVVAVSVRGEARAWDARTGQPRYVTELPIQGGLGDWTRIDGHVWLVAGEDRLVRVRLTDGQWTDLGVARVGPARQVLIGALARGDTVTTLAYREIRSPTLGVGGELWMVHRHAWSGAFLGEFRFPMDTIALDSPTSLAGPNVILTDGERGILHAWDRSTGRLAWSYKATGNRILNLVPAVAAGDTVFMAGGPGLHAIDNRTGRLLFLVPSRVSLRSLAVCPDVVYAEGADIDVIDRRTGRSRGLAYRSGGTPETATWDKFGVGEGIAFNYLVGRAYAFRCGPMPG